MELSEIDKIKRAVEGMKDIDWNADDAVPDDVQNRIVDKLTDPDNRFVASEFSMNQVKLLTRIKGIGRICDDKIKLKAVDDFALFMFSKERRRSKELIELGKPQPLFQDKPSRWSRLFGKST